MKEEQLHRVTKRKPCPICGKPDWCGMSSNSAVCVCMRISDGARRKSQNGGYVHRLTDAPCSITHRRITCNFQENKSADFSAIADQYRHTVCPEKLRELADGLGLSADALLRLRIGWDAGSCAWSFPMTDAARRVIGIRLRALSGRKFALTGSREGLFVPDGLTYSGLLLICEGASDCAAILDLDFEAIGRPSCTGGVVLCVELVRNHYPLAVVIVSDVDTPGQRGAKSLASALLPYAESVRVIRPPDGIKDGRAWKIGGATRADIQAVIDAAFMGKFTIKGACHV